MTMMRVLTLVSAAATALLVSPSLALHRYTPEAESDEISALPGWEGDLPSRMYRYTSLLSFSPYSFLSFC